MASILQTLSLSETDAAMIPVGTILFFLFYRALSQRFFKPLIELIEERERRTTGAEHDRDTLREKTQDILNRIDVRTSLADAEIQAERRLIVENARAEAAAIIESAERQVAELLKEKRLSADEECALVRTRTFVGIDEVAEAIAQRVLEPSAEYRPLH